MKKWSDCTGIKLTILYLVSLTIRFFVGNYYPRTVNCYPDELLYLATGESLWNNHCVQVFNVASNFRKIGYATIIAPAFAIADVKLRGTAIAFINAGVISLGVFPVYGLAKRILKKNTNIWLCVLFYLISPSLTYSMTYMSEVLSIPLALLLLYCVYRLCWDADRRHRKWWAISVFLLMALNYAVKSVAAVYMVAFACVYLTKGFFSENKKHRIIFAIFLLFGLICFGVLYQHGFLGLNQLGIMGKKLYIIYTMLFFVLCSILGFCILPVLLPMICYRELDKKTKGFFLYLLYILLITAVVVACMIYTTEDYPSLTPRAHLRYVEFMFVPFFMIMLQLLENETYKKIGRMQWTIVGVWAVAFILVFRGYYGQTIDQTLIFYLQLFAEEGKYFSVWRVRFISAGVAVVVVILLKQYNNNRQRFQKILVVGMLILCMGNSVLSAYIQYKTHSHSVEETREAERLRQFALTHKEETILVLEPENYNELIDTFLIDCDNVRTGEGLFITQREECYEKPSQFSYIVLFDGEYTVADNVKKIDSYESLGYILYQVGR